MGKEIFHINVDTTVLKKLRMKVNEHFNITYNKRYGKHRAWDKICAIMDRLDETVEYLNQLELNAGKFDRNAFDFCDFMNNGSVVIDCVKELARIFNVSDDAIRKSNEIFHELGNDEKGSDEKYFEYLRSLCSVHPIETSRHERYQANEFECSPFVIWNNGFRSINDDCDIYAVVYISKDRVKPKRIPIHMQSIFEYIKIWIDFINGIINGINIYYKKVICCFQNKHIKKDTEFCSYVAYLENLSKEQKARFGFYTFYPLDDVIRFFKFRLTKSLNQNKLNLYLNALKYAISFEHNNLQNMCSEGYENNGLICPRNTIDTTLYNEIYSPHSGSKEQTSYDYYLEKISCLGHDSEYNDKQWAYMQLKFLLPFLERYVSFKEAYEDFEYYTLVHVALYLECLENNCLINKNIPNDLKYRVRLLTDEEINELFTD